MRVVRRLRLEVPWLCGFLLWKMEQKRNVATGLALGVCVREALHCWRAACSRGAVCWARGAAWRWQSKRAWSSWSSHSWAELLALPSSRRGAGSCGGLGGEVWKLPSLSDTKWLECPDGVRCVAEFMAAWDSVEELQGVRRAVDGV